MGWQGKASLRREPLSPDPAEDKRISLEAIWLKRFLGNVGKQDVQSAPGGACLLCLSENNNEASKASPEERGEDSKTA